jgi:hypothetical protein
MCQNSEIERRSFLNFQMKRGLTSSSADQNRGILPPSPEPEAFLALAVHVMGSVITTLRTDSFRTRPSLFTQSLAYWRPTYLLHKSPRCDVLPSSSFFICRNADHLSAHHRLVERQIRSSSEGSHCMTRAMTRRIARQHTHKLPQANDSTLE